MCSGTAELLELTDQRRPTVKFSKAFRTVLKVLYLLCLDCHYNLFGKKRMLFLFAFVFDCSLCTTAVHIGSGEGFV